MRIDGENRWLNEKNELHNVLATGVLLKIKQPIIPFKTLAIQ